MSLETIPAEILEYVAFLVATDRFLGPPADLIPLLLTSQAIYAALSPSSNPHLYSSIFEAKFDVGLARKRLGSTALTADVLTQELKRRILLLKRIQAMDSALTPGASEETTHDILLTAYLMMLEDQGKNRDQLEKYAKLPDWLTLHWFHEDGSSGAVQRVNTGYWPTHTLNNALGMWLLWFFLKPDAYPSGTDSVETQLNLLKVHALGAHRYTLSSLSWQHFDCSENPVRALTTSWYSQSVLLAPPALAVPAILSFFALTNRRRPLPLAPAHSSIPRTPLRDDWAADWGRAVHSLETPRHKKIRDCFAFGSIEGVWEGYFMYTEFTMYALVLAGATPNTLQKGLVGKHQQTWKLREHYLLDEQVREDDAMSTSQPLPAGNPLRAWIPTGSKLIEHRDGVTVEEPGRSTPLRYISANVLPPDSEDRVIDILITGELGANSALSEGFVPVTASSVSQKIMWTEIEGNGYIEGILLETLMGTSWVDGGIPSPELSDRDMKERLLSAVGGDGYLGDGLVELRGPYRHETGPHVLMLTD